MHPGGGVRNGRTGFNRNARRIPGQRGQPAHGLGNAIVNARSNAKLSLSGLGSVVVYGKPANRDVSVDGLGKVSWK